MEGRRPNSFRRGKGRNPKSEIRRPERLISIGCEFVAASDFGFRSFGLLSDFGQAHEWASLVLFCSRNSDLNRGYHVGFFGSLGSALPSWFIGRRRSPSRRKPSSNQPAC